jgi:hypothetical protein
MVFIRSMVTHLHHERCVHSILPLAPRAKQPALHIHTRNTAKKASDRCEHNRTQGCGTRPVSIGIRRRRAEWTGHVLASVLVHVWCASGGEGGTLRHMNVLETTRMLWDSA